MLSPAPDGLSFELAERPVSPTYRESARVRHELVVRWRAPELHPHGRRARLLIRGTLGLALLAFVLLTRGRGLPLALPLAFLLLRGVVAARPHRLLATSEGIFVRVGLWPRWVPADGVQALLVRPLEPMTVTFEDDEVSMRRPWELVALRRSGAQISGAPSSAAQTSAAQTSGDAAPICLATKLSREQVLWLEESLSWLWALRPA